MISPIRLRSLRAQAAAAHGYTPTTLDRLIREDRPMPDALGPAIIVTLGELRELLAAYDIVHKADE